MFEIDSLKNYINNNDEFINKATSIYELTENVSKDYPNYKNWFFDKQLPGLTTKERNILFISYKKEIIAVSNLKKNNEELKICTLFVSDKFRGLGIGSILLEESMKWLGTTKPFITFADYKLDMFKPLVDKYNWELIETIENSNNKELCFNGNLIKKNNNLK